MTINEKDIRELLQSDTYIDIDSMSFEELSQSFSFLNKGMMIIYLFVLKYNEYLNARHPYTDEDALTTLEAHLLTDICDYPGSTVTGLAAAWDRSVSATSQTIRKLMQMGLVTRENSKENATVFFLMPTEKGLLVSTTHKKYDTLDTIKTLKCLLHDLSPEEIHSMFKGIAVFLELLKKRDS